MNISVIGVIGAGQMGGGIAEVCAARGYRVRLADVRLDVASAGKDAIAARLEARVKGKKLAAEDREAILAKIESVALEDVSADAQLVIEAATENTDVKLALFRQLSAAAGADTLLASNTSSISITKLAAVTRTPKQVVGVHFMNPVPVMKLVELVRGTQTSAATLAAARQFAESLGKQVIVSADSPGFLVNRVLIPFINEACLALQEGVGTAEDIDKGAVLGLNHPLGPLALADLIGLDTVLAIAEVLHRELGEDKYRPAVNLRNLVAAGWLGRKSGRGFYVYKSA